MFFFYFGDKKTRFNVFYFFITFIISVIKSMYKRVAFVVQVSERWLLFGKKKYAMTNVHYFFPNVCYIYPEKFAIAGKRQIK